MTTSKISAKYQVVIPKELRKRLNLKPGQKVSLSLDKQNNIKISTTDPVQELKNKYAGKWGNDPVAHVRKLRDEWED